MPSAQSDIKDAAFDSLEMALIAMAVEELSGSVPPVDLVRDWRTPGDISTFVQQRVR